MNFYHYMEDREYKEEIKDIVLNSLEATKEALDSPLISFKKYKDLISFGKNPKLGEMIEESGNKPDILKAVRDAKSSKITIADFIDLFTFEEE